MAPIAEWSHETVLAAEPVSARLARDFVRLHLVAHHLRHLVEDMSLVVSELATNAVVHARTPFRVTLLCTGGSVVLSVRDGSARVPVRGTPDVMDGSGRGLVIVEGLSARWGTDAHDDGNKSVWACFPERVR